ncbi:MAG: hypothetical protein HZB80_03605 [Deltaproteobacteria bacterium]|nr:hypothetical protein [Deltaproteobacteria bacterium]
MKKSYYNQQSLQEMLNALKKSNKCQPWFPDAIKLLGKKIESIPIEEDENRFIIEFVYPH